MKYLVTYFIIFNVILNYVESVKLNSKFFEKNSILLRKRRATYLEGRGKFNEFPIKYKIDKNVRRKLVKDAIALVEKETCVKFKEDKRLNGSGLIFILSHDHYYAEYVGKVSSIRPLKIGIAKKPVRVGFAVHEILHALGLFHEHERLDREKYIEIKFDNIQEKYHDQFKLANPITKETFGIKYDYGSMLHYEREAGHKEDTDSNITITTHNKHYFYSIGQRTDISFLDGKLLNKRYCNDKCKDKPKLHCYYGGYPNPKKCDECKCPTFYEPPFCKFVKKSHEKCGKKIRMATEKEQVLKMKGKYDCYYIIRAKKNQVVEMKIKKLRSFLKPICQPGSGLNIKFLKNKAISPACFCGKITNYKIESEGREVVLRFAGKSKCNYFVLTYKSVEKFVSV